MVWKPIDLLILFIKLSLVGFEVSAFGPNSFSYYPKKHCRVKLENFLPE